MDRHEVLALTIVCLLAVAVGLALLPSRYNVPPSIAEHYSTTTSFATTTVTVTESVSSSIESVSTFGYTAAYALLGPPVGPISGYLPPNQSGCTYFFGSDRNTYALYNLPVGYSTGQVTLYGQYLTWEPSPQDSCNGIRIYVTSISRQ